MATKKLPHNEVFEAKTLLLKGAIKLPKNFIYKSSLVKAITDKYRLKRLEPLILNKLLAIQAAFGLLTLSVNT